MSDAGFEERLAAVATARSWPERVVQGVREAREALAAEPDATATLLARQFGLQGFDESLLAQLHQKRELALGTVWSPFEPNEATEPLEPVGTSTPVEVAPVSLEPTEASPPREGERTVRGPTLLAVEATLPLARAIVAMVARAHEQGVVVRNLSLGNLLVGSLGEVVLRDPAATPLPAFHSPEQAAGNEGLTPASDVFALGSLLFEWFGGVPLFGHLGASETLDAIRTDRRRSPKRPLPDGIQRLVERATRPEPSARYADARAMLRAIAVGDSESTHLAEADRERSAARDLEAATAALPEGPDRWVQLERAQAHRRAARVLEHEALLGAVAQGSGPALRAAHARLRPDLDAFDEAVLRATADLGIAKPGRGRFQLHTEQPATVDLYRHDLREGRLWPEPMGSLGETPVDVRLPHGSYLALVHPAEGPDLRYPFWIDRYGRWDGVPEGSDEPAPIPLPDEPRKGLVPVSGGWSRLGVKPRWTWVDGFWMQKHPVSTGDYVGFLTHLMSTGRREKAEAWMPSAGPRLTWRDGTFRIDGWDPDWPVVGVPFAGATAYVAWRSEVDEVAWTLPTGDQWEKAARGADARDLPWGSRPAALFARFASDTPVQSPTLSADASPYGVRGLGGNVRDWVLDPATAGWALARGGCYASPPDDLVAWRSHLVPASGSALVGFRMVCPL